MGGGASHLHDGDADRHDERYGAGGSEHVREPGRRGVCCKGVLGVIDMNKLDADQKEIIARLTEEFKKKYRKEQGVWLDI